MFESVRKFMLSFLQHGKVLDDEFRELYAKTKGAVFIFSKDISNFIKEVDDKANKHKCNDDLCKTREPGDQTWEVLTQENEKIFKWFRNALETLDETFKKDLKLKS